MFVSNKNVLGVKLGTTNVSEVYLGSTPLLTQDGYDVFLIAGQSNTFNGILSSGDSIPNSSLDTADADILQWGRFSPNNGVIISATVPLQHRNPNDSQPSGVLGWGQTFAKMYKASGYLHGNRKILLVPCGKGSTGFAANNWNKGNTEYNDAITRTQAALAAGSGTNVLKGILWHQGEADASNSTNAANHATALLAMIDDMRTDLGYPNVPFIAGGLVPALVDAPLASYATVNSNIEAIVTARTYTGYADPASPTELTTEGTPTGSNNHYSTYSMRGSSHNFSDYTTLGLAGRYWVAYLSALNNN